MTYDEGLAKAMEMEAHMWDGMTEAEIQMAKDTQWQPHEAGIVRDVRKVMLDYRLPTTDYSYKWLTEEQQQYIQTHRVEKKVLNVRGLHIELETGGVVIVDSKRLLLSRTATFGGYVYWRIDRRGMEDPDWEYIQGDIIGIIPAEVESSVSKEERWEWCKARFKECEVTKLYNELVIKAEKWGGVTVLGEKSARRASTRARYRSKTEMEEQRFSSRDGVDRGTKWFENPELSEPYLTYEELVDRDFVFMLNHQIYLLIKAQCREVYWDTYSKRQQDKFGTKPDIASYALERRDAATIVALEHWHHVARQELKQTSVRGDKVKFRKTGKVSKRTKDMQSYTFRKLPEVLQKYLMN